MVHNNQVCNAVRLCHALLRRRAAAANARADTQRRRFFGCPRHARVPFCCTAGAHLPAHVPHVGCSHAPASAERPGNGVGRGRAAAAAAAAAGRATTSSRRLLAAPRGCTGVGGQAPCRPPPLRRRRREPCHDDPIVVVTRTQCDSEPRLLCGLRFGGVRTALVRRRQETDRTLAWASQPTRNRDDPRQRNRRRRCRRRWDDSSAVC